jgi:hypothetical protein
LKFWSRKNSEQASWAAIENDSSFRSSLDETVLHLLPIHSIRLVIFEEWETLVLLFTLY